MTLEKPSINYLRRLSFDRNNSGRASAPQLPHPPTIEPPEPLKPVEPMSQTEQKFAQPTSHGLQFGAKHLENATRVYNERICCPQRFK